MNNHNLSGFYKAIAKVICYVPNIEQKEFIKTLRVFIIHEARNMYPDVSISNLSQITGIQRSLISKLLEIKRPKKILNKDSVVLAELWRIKDKKNIVKIKGRNSFYSVSKPILNSSYKPEACLNSLIVCNAVELSKKGLLIKSNTLNLSFEKEKFSHLINKVTERYIDTLLYNFETNNEEKLFEQTYSSTKIPYEKLKTNHTQIKDYLNKITYPQIQKIIDSNEVDVDSNTFPVYSLSIFEYMGGNFKL